MPKKPVKKKEIPDYIRYYIKSKDAENIIKGSKIINSEGFDLWSFKKLILLEYYIRPYLNILLSRDHKCFFIDFFSGCGANKIERENIVSIGSPIISILKGIIPIKSKKTNNRFHKWFFIDKEKSFCEALRLRLIKTLKIINKEYNEKLELDEDINIINGDCNKEIDIIVEELEKESKKHKIAILAFIDPYTFTNIEWKTWEKLLSLKVVDIIFTFPIQTIERGYKTCKNLKKYLSPSLNKLLEEYKEIGKIPEKKFEKAYAKDIYDLVYRSITHYDVGIGVKNLENREIYRITLFSHSRPAVGLTIPFAKKLDMIKAKDIKSMVEQINGKLRSLKEFEIGQ